MLFSSSPLTWGNQIAICFYSIETSMRNRNKMINMLNVLFELLFNTMPIFYCSKNIPLAIKLLFFKEKYGVFSFSLPWFLRASFLLPSGHEKKISCSDFVLLLIFFSWLCLFPQGIGSVGKLRKQSMCYLGWFPHSLLAQ